MDPQSDRSRRIAGGTALAIALAVPAEGIRQWAYYDPPGILTVCYGHTGPDVRKGVKYELSECKALLTEDMRGAVEQVERCAPGLPEPALAAFSDAVFNMGPKIACNTKSSAAARYLALGQIEAACNQLPNWNRAKVAGVSVPLPGLTTRRAKERALCLQGVTKHE